MAREQPRNAVQAFASDLEPLDQSYNRGVRAGVKCRSVHLCSGSRRSGKVL